MKIVIDIPEDSLLACKHWVKEGVAQWAEAIIAKGTPLPKGHGRLIDADKLYEDFIDGTEGYDCNTWNRIEIGDIIEDATTIIEANKEAENDSSLS